MKKLIEACLLAIVVLGCALALPGCAGGAPVAQEVKVPVITPCVKNVPARPDFAVQSLSTNSSDGEKVLAIARDVPAHLKYEAQLEAVIEGCR